MAGCSKITKGGLEFIKQEYSIEPLIHFTEIQKKYNVKAKIVGWPIIHSTGTIINHLVNMGVYKRASRFIPKRINDKGKKEVIEISLELQREIAKVFKVTERTVQSAMRFETQSPTARRHPPRYTRPKSTGRKRRQLPDTDSSPAGCLYLYGQSQLSLSLDDGQQSPYPERHRHPRKYG